MAKNLKELRDLRGKAVADARQLVDAADAAKRSMNEDEKRQYESFMSDAVRLKADIDTEERTQDVERELAAEGIRSAAAAGQESRGGNPSEEARTLAFRKLILEGNTALTHEELRGLTAGTDIKGGFTLTPQEFINQLIVNVKNMVFMRQLATIIPLNGSSSCGVPTLDSDVGDADWTPEIKVVGEDDGLAFGKRELKPHALSKLVKVSEPLLRNSALNPEAIVNDRMSYKFGVSMEKAYLLGDGAQKPLGVFVASTDGIPTSRDVSAGNTATSIGADGLIAAKYSLKAQYMGKAQWLFHRDAVKQLAQLKDGNGRYMFELSDTPNVPDMLLGRPMTMSEYAPNTFTTGQYVGMFADFSNYWIADSLQLQFRRLNELFSLSNQVGFIGRMETDGMPVLAEAFSRVKLG
jgi:HK97 family phage major capsid protein